MVETNKDIKGIKVQDRFREFLIPLTEEEKHQLEENLLREGCREPLTVWEKSKDELILLDGHNRFEICERNDIAFNIEKLKFQDFESAKQWMINNQFGRRNLNPDQLSYFRGLKYLHLKKQRGGFENASGKGETVNVKELLSEEFKVSESTIKRDAKFAQALMVVEKSNIGLRNELLAGETDIKKSDLLVLLKSENSSRMKFKNSKDLFNKIHNIKNDLLKSVEEDLQRIEEEQEGMAEPLFLDFNQRVTKIKGQIISSMNKAITNRNVETISELKILIDKLEVILLDK